MLYDRIKKLASEHAITIKELEKKLGFGNGSMRRWNQNSPSIDKITKVANYFSVSVDYLLGRTDYPYVSNSKQETLGMAAHYSGGRRSLTAEQIKKLDEMTNAIVAGYEAQNKKDKE